MKIIPAIDISGGQCVRLMQGDFTKRLDYGRSPLYFAKQWEEQGATRLHLVDLDGSRLGAPVNFPAIAQILKGVSIPCDVGGGIRTPAQARFYKNMGADRVVVSTVAVKQEEAFIRMMREVGDSLVVSIDAKNGIAMAEGWKSSSGVLASEMLLTLALNGVKRVNYTDTERDGTREGPNLEAIRHMVKRAQDLTNPIEVTASGGASSIEDLLEVEETGVKAFIIGRALYEGGILLPEAIARCS